MALAQKPAMIGNRLAKPWRKSIGRLPKSTAAVLASAVKDRTIQDSLAFVRGKAKKSDPKYVSRLIFVKLVGLLENLEHGLAKQVVAELQRGGSVPAVSAALGNMGLNVDQVSLFRAVGWMKVSGLIANKHRSKGKLVTARCFANNVPNLFNPKIPNGLLN